MVCNILKSTFDDREYIQHDTYKIECLTHNICYYVKSGELNEKDQSRGCKLCGNEIRSIKTTMHNKINHVVNRKTSIQKLEKIIHDNLQDKYEVLINLHEIKTNGDKIPVLCKIHDHKYTTTINAIKDSKSKGCKFCRAQRRINNSNAITVKEYTKRLNAKKTNVKLIPETYKGKLFPAKFICSVHGEFEQIAVNVLDAKFGCAECAKEMKNTRAISYDEFVTKAKELHINNSKPIYKYDKSDSDYVNLQSVVNIYCSTHGKFEMVADYHLHNKNGCPKCRTKTQLKISNIIESLGFDVINNYRFGLGRQEVDIFIPSKNIAIEYHGLLWHSYGTTYPNNAKLMNKKVDKIKYDYLAEQGIQLITIWDNEWNDIIKQKIWLSLLRNKLNLIPKDNIIGARKCEIREVSSAISKEFQEQNHLQGNNYSKVNLGLYYQDELMALMTFKKDVTHRAEYELVRFCNKINYQVQGGASKLLKYFERNYNPKSILSYANKRWSNGNLYNSLNFEFVKHTDPSYFYYLEKNHSVSSRNSFQKHMLKNKLAVLEEDKTETENMFNNEYRVLYDAGNFTYIKKY